jgi:hypothetical protein
MNLPASRYRVSSRAMPEHIREPESEPQAHVRRVFDTGWFSFRGRAFPCPSAFPCPRAFPCRAPSPAERLPLPSAFPCRAPSSAKPFAMSPNTPLPCPGLTMRQCPRDLLCREHLPLHPSVHR